MNGIMNAVFVASSVSIESFRFLIFDTTFLTASSNSITIPQHENRILIIVYTPYSAVVELEVVLCLFGIVEAVGMALGSS